MSRKVFLFVLAISVSCYGSPTVDRPEEPLRPAEEVPAKTSETTVNVPSVEEPTKPVNEGPRGARSYVENDVQTSSQFEENLLRKLNNKCTQRDTSSCAMLKLVTYMNRLLKKADIAVTDDIEITQSATTAQVNVVELPRSLNNEPEETQLAELLTGKLVQFLRSRALRLRLLPTTEVVFTSNPDNEGNLNLGMAVENLKEEGRGKNKNMGGLMAAIVMKMGMLGALAFKGLALLVGKALLISKIALLLAVVIGLKKLFSQQKHVTYEVVAQPHHSHSHVEHADHGHSSGGGGGGGHDSYSSGWARSIGVAPYGKGDGQDLAYGAQAPK